MKWFKHDGNALHDAKIEKLIMKFGIDGYGLYFACVEIIAGALSSDNITFELEHDAEVLANKFKMDSRRVEDIMKYAVSIGLFQFNSESGRIACLSLAKRLDISTSNNPEFKKMRSKLLETNSNYQKLLPVNSRREEKRIQEKRIQEKRIDKITISRPDKILFLEVVKLTQIEYDKLVKKYGKSNTDDLIERLNNYIQSKGVKYKSHYHTILNWASKDSLDKGDKKGQVKTDADWAGMESALSGGDKK